MDPACPAKSSHSSNAARLPVKQYFSDNQMLSMAIATIADIKLLPHPQGFDQPG